MPFVASKVRPIPAIARPAAIAAQFFDAHSWMLKLRALLLNGPRGRGPRQLVPKSYSASCDRRARGHRALPCCGGQITVEQTRNNFLAQRRLHSGVADHDLPPIFSAANRIASAATSGSKIVPVGRALCGILFFVQVNCVVFSPAC